MENLIAITTKISLEKGEAGRKKGLKLVCEAALTISVLLE